MKLKCLLVDDEPIARDVIESYIAQVATLELVETCSSAVEAFAFLQTNRVDLIFLDIQMPQLTGLELLKTITNPPKIIITTAYREYAVESFELDVVDYLVKPIPFERFIKAVGKVHQHTEPKEQLPVIAQEEPFIFIKEERKLIKIYLREILFLESLRDYVKITTLSKTITTRHTLGYFEELLPESQFIRIHRSFVIAISKIESISENKIGIGGTELAIGGNYKQAVLDQLKIRQFIK
jgi:DNA-binding LytR/AlgR family response regulator